MANIGEHVERMVEMGFSIKEASDIAAAIFAAGVDAAAVRKSAGALRTQKWREKRHQASHGDGQSGASQTVTNRHQASQCDSALYIEDKNSKKKKDRASQSRASQIPPDFMPDNFDEVAAKIGRESAAIELAKFTDHAKAKGRVCKDWQAAWRNWLRSDYRTPQKNAPGAVSANSRGNPMTDKMPLEDAIKHFIRFQRWSPYAPVNDISDCPPDLLAKHGLSPDGRKLTGARG